MTLRAPERRKDRGLLLRGIDGANPLGFLASLGALRVGTIVWPDREVELSWKQHVGAWRPLFHVDPVLTEEEITVDVCGYLQCGTDAAEATDANHGSPDAAEAFPHFSFEKNTKKIPPARFREIALKARASSSTADRAYPDFIAALGCEACVEDGHVQDTALRTMSGSGHQHFLETMLNLARDIEPDHVRSTLFERWTYEDPLKNHSMRWDPRDNKRHAYQWTDPTDSSERKSGGMWGANRLAIEGLPMLPTMPSRRLETTGFQKMDRGGPVWTWPIWSCPIPMDVCASLLALPDLQRQPLDRSTLTARGIVEVFRSRRIAVDYYRNFTPARAVVMT